MCNKELIELSKTPNQELSVTVKYLIVKIQWKTLYLKIVAPAV